MLLSVEPPFPPAAAVFATVVIASPSVSNACWSNNPCAYDEHALPISCKDNGKGELARRSQPRTRAAVTPLYAAASVPMYEHMAGAAGVQEHSPHTLTQCPELSRAGPADEPSPARAAWSQASRN